MTENEDPEKKGGVWALDQQLDQPMDEEANKFSNVSEDKKCSSITVLQLAFQSLGVVYGDLGTSPLYVFYNTFPYGIDEPDDLLGALSVVIYSLTLIALVKYVLIVCRANDNGQGGGDWNAFDKCHAPHLEVFVTSSLVHTKMTEHFHTQKAGAKWTNNIARRIHLCSI